MNEVVWHIAGIGAVGTIIASSFCRGQHSVTLVLKGDDKLALYDRCGLDLNADEFDYQCHPNAIPVAAIDSPIKYLICCTKAYDVSNLLVSLSPHLSNESIIIIVHNGMGVLDEIKARLPKLRIISGITTLGGYLTRPYSVNAFLKGTITIGETIGHCSSDEIRLIKETFHKSKLTAVWTDSMADLIWDKFSINCSINLLTALYSCKNGELLQHPDLLNELTEEIAMVLRAYGKEIQGSALFNNVCKVIKNTSGNYSSMNQDIKNNRQTELRYLNVHLQWLAEQKKIQIPLTTELLNRFYAQFPYQLIR